MDQHIKRIHDDIPKIKEICYSDLSPVVNNIVHALTAKYPKNEYRPGMLFTKYYINLMKYIHKINIQDGTYLFVFY